MEVVCGIEISDLSNTSTIDNKINELKDKIFKSINKQLYKVIYLDKLEESAKFIANDLINTNKLN